MFSLKRNRKIKRKLLLKYIIVGILSVVVIGSLVLLYKNTLIVLPYSQKQTRVMFSRDSFKQAMKITGYEGLIVRPSILILIDHNMPHPENLLRFQRTTEEAGSSIPSFGCSYKYSNFSRRLMTINFHVRGSEYLDRIKDADERSVLLNASIVSCLIDIFAPESRKDETKMDEIWSQFNKMQSELPAIFEFKVD